MQLNIEIEVQGCEQADINVTQQYETLTLEIIDAPFYPSVVIDDAAGLGGTDVTWSADKSSRELADKVDKVAGYSLVSDDEIAKLSTVEQDAQKNTVNSVAGKQGDVLLDKTDVGLGAVDNTADADKPVSTAVAAALDDKVDKVTGKGLSDTNFTQAEKDKLSSLESSKFVGLFVSESALPLSGSEGDYANVDGGAGSDVYRVIWDSSDNKWVRVQGVSTELTDAQIKQQYESNPDTNAFTDDEKAKLAGVAEGATANRADSENADEVHEHDISDVTGLSDALLTKFDKTDVVQSTGQSTEKVMSQKAVTDALDVIYLSIPTIYIPTPTPTPVAFGDPLEGGFYSGMIWNRIALCAESKTLQTGKLILQVDRSGAIVYTGQTLEVRSISDPSKKFIGVVDGAYPSRIVLNVASVQGSGTYSDWAVMSRFRNIIAPKAQGESVLIALKFEATAMPTATQTLTEGWEATNAMLAAGTAAQYPAAHWARALVINGYSDWYIPARDELELAWRNLKPVTTDNYIGARYNSPISYKQSGAYPDATAAQGVNLNSSPQSPAYTLTDPAQTSSAAFRAGGSEEFAWGNYFWTSSEATDTHAWFQHWYASYPGTQHNGNKTSPRRVRAVRRSII